MNIEYSCDLCGELAAYEIADAGSDHMQFLCKQCAINRINRTGASSVSSSRSNPLQDLLDAIGNLPPLDRARQAVRLSDDLRSELAMLRRDAIRELRAQRWRWSEIGNALGISSARAANIAAGKDTEYKANRRRASRLMTGWFAEARQVEQIATASPVREGGE